MFGPYLGRLVDRRLELSVSGLIPGFSQGARANPVRATCLTGTEIS